MRRVYLVGFMGAGKSTVGTILAELMGASFVDLDGRIEERSGLSISKIFETQGESAFRELESAELLRASLESPGVIACGGGAVLSDENRRVIKESGCVLYLAASAEVVMARIGGADSRPLLAGGGGEVAAELLDARRSLYESVADVSVDTSGRTPEEVATAAIEALTACGRFRDE